ncbi:MAG TPA: DUF5615 family PIN-like protein [Candidatus Nanoarchaeia archaeon]|nr:DUF5615 family PIN-like protein [Candidatus Nanoarchaeia archaeon]
MRFIADENIPSSLVEAVRRKGYSIEDVKEEGLIGAKDTLVMEISKKEKRIIITFDKDFATYPREKHSGVILLRYKNKNSHNATEKFCYLLDSPIKEKFENALCEVFDDRVIIHTE